MNKNIIVCDECQSEFNPNDIKFKKANTTIDDKKFEIVYYRCPECKKVYVVCMLDYWGEKLQNNYVKAMDSYRLNYKNHASKVILDQKLKKVNTLKEEAMKYQSELLQKYGELLPEELFEDEDNLE